MIISFSQKFIFVAIPKTAGHTIRDGLRPALAPSDWEQCTLFDKKYFPVAALAAVGHGHITAQQIQPFLLPSMWKSYFTFCFVRNPYDRFVSYCFFTKTQNIHIQADPTDAMKKILHKSKREPRILCQPQYTFVTDESNQIVVDFVGKYETLQGDFESIGNQIAIPTSTLPHINASTRREYQHYFDSELQEMVFEYYKQDFEMFGYSKELD